MIYFIIWYISGIYCYLFWPWYYEKNMIELEELYLKEDPNYDFDIRNELISSLPLWALLGPLNIILNFPV